MFGVCIDGGMALARVKTCFDATLVLSALAVSYVPLHRVEGVREGTVLGVFLVGWFVGLAPSRRRASVGRAGAVGALLRPALAQRVEILVDVARVGRLANRADAKRLHRFRCGAAAAP